MFWHQDPQEPPQPYEKAGKWNYRASGGLRVDLMCIYIYIYICYCVVTQYSIGCYRSHPCPVERFSLARRAAPTPGGLSPKLAVRALRSRLSASGPLHAMCSRRPCTPGRHVRARLHIYIYIYIYTYYTHVCMYVCVYIYIYIERERDAVD